jgi:hypothetical protein
VEAVHPTAEDISYERDPQSTPHTASMRGNWLLEMMFQFKIVNRRENCNRSRSAGKKGQIITPTASFCASSTSAVDAIQVDPALTDSMSTTVQKTLSQTGPEPAAPSLELDFMRNDGIVELSISY